MKFPQIIKNDQLIKMSTKRLLSYKNRLHAHISAVSRPTMDYDTIVDIMKNAGDIIPRYPCTTEELIQKYLKKYVDKIDDLKKILAVREHVE